MYILPTEASAQIRIDGEVTHQTMSQMETKHGTKSSHPARLLAELGYLSCNQKACQDE